MQIDLKKISAPDLMSLIMSLKMGGFSFVEQDALLLIQEKIKHLPSREVLQGLGEKAINEVKVQVGDILKLLEVYGARNKEFKVRQRSRTKIPTRYNVLEWKNMKNKAEMVGSIVKLSAQADSSGNHVLANKTLKIAKDLQSGVYNESEIDEVIKTAAWQDWGQNIKNVFQDVKQTFSDKGALNESWRKFETLINSFVATQKSITDLSTHMEKLKNGAWQPGIKSTIDKMIAKLAEINPKFEGLNIDLGEMQKLVEWARKGTLANVGDQPTQQAAAAPTQDPNQPAAAPAAPSQAPAAAPVDWEATARANGWEKVQPKAQPKARRNRPA